MRSKTYIRGLLLATIAACVAGASAAGAQQTRAEFIRSGWDAYSQFQTQEALELLRTGINPSLGGPLDRTWESGVHRMAYIHLLEGQPDIARIWLRWAVRLKRDFAIDSVTFRPDNPVIIALKEAVAYVGQETEADLAVVTSWTWPLQRLQATTGELRARAPGLRERLAVDVNGRGPLESNPTLPPNSYVIKATAPGYDSVSVTREILPGVVTSLSFTLPPLGAVVSADELPPDVRSRGLARLARITPLRMGGNRACATGFFATGDGLLLTSYRSIRGAQDVQVRTADGREIGNGVRVAAYDVAEDLAVLQVPVSESDSLVVTSQAPGAAEAVWGLTHQDCAEPGVSKVNVTPQADQTLGVSGAFAEGDQGGPLVNRGGRVVGIARGSGSATGHAAVAALLARARANAARGQLVAVRRVATDESHLYGTLDIQSNVPGAQARIRPLEPWHWGQLARTMSVPSPFSGPVGRYAIELIVGGQVRDSTQVAIVAGTTRGVPLGQVADNGGGGGSKAPIIVAAVGAAGVLGYLLLGNTPPPPGTDTGSIGVVVTIPNN